MNIANDLADLKSRIESNKTKKIKLEGQKDQCYDYLKEQFSCNNLEEGLEKLKEFEEKASNLEKKIEKNILKINNILNKDDMDG
jgi:hypothetical protein